MVPNTGDLNSLCWFGSVLAEYTMQTTYIVDSYPRLAASGVAAVVALRSLAGLGSPLFLRHTCTTRLATGEDTVTWTGQLRSLGPGVVYLLDIWGDVEDQVGRVCGYARLSL